jgi:hypothetical protein
VVLLNVPKDRGDFFRCFGELALRLGFERSDLVADSDRIEVRESVHRALRFGDRLVATLADFATTRRAALGGCTGRSVGRFIK